MAIIKTEKMICDLCGKEMKTNQVSEAEPEKIQMIQKEIWYGGYMYIGEICYECSSILNSFIKKKFPKANYIERRNK